MNKNSAAEAAKFFVKPGFFLAAKTNETHITVHEQYLVCSYILVYSI